MRIIISGAGQVGYGIAERLSLEGNDITVIDRSAELVTKIRETLDARGVVGHGAHPDILDKAGAVDADMFIAVTQIDEVNMIGCQVAHSLFSIPTRVARIRSQPYLSSHWQDLFSRHHLPIDVIISPEIEVGELIMRRLAAPGAVDIVPFADGLVTFLTIELVADSAIIDTPMRQLTELFPNLDATVVGFIRNSKVTIARSDDAFMADDIAIVVVPTDHVERTLGIFDRPNTPPDRIVIAGAGNIGSYLANNLSNLPGAPRVKIIDFNKNVAQDAAEHLTDAVVVHGDALKADILKEVDVIAADLFIALTDDDETNILSSIMAKDMGCKANLALVNQPQYERFSRRLGIDSYVNPRSVTVSKILQHVRRGRVRGVYSLHDGAAELMEAEALETSPMVGKQLREIDFLDGMRVGAIVRENKVIMPQGETVVEAGDAVLLFAIADHRKDVETLFRVSLDFF